MSPRNSAAAICDMVKKVGAHRLMVTAASLGSLPNEVKEELAMAGYHLDIEELPAFPDIYPRLTHETAADPFEPIPLPARDTFINEVVIYIHSSGSTGFPKPIPWTHRVFSKFAFAALVDELRSLDKDMRKFFVTIASVCTHQYI
jgi:acyl-coenzyme A synthetase/AMP-(fatty) acid ligase